MEKSDDHYANTETEKKKGKGCISFTCDICVEPLVCSTIFTNLHKHRFCDECMAKYIQIQVEEHASFRIKCPQIGCSNILDPLSCRSIITPTIFSRWCHLYCTAGDLEFESRSYCPNTNCLELVVNECGGVVKKTKCPNCKQLFCFNCKSDWHSHPWFRCKPSEDENEILFGNLVINKRWKRCPHCGLCVERLSGCSHIQCRCGSSSCYKCGHILSVARVRLHASNWQDNNESKDSVVIFCKTTMMSFILFSSTSSNIVDNE